MVIKKLLEAEQGRLNRLVSQGRIAQADANETVREYARVIGQYCEN